MINGIILTRMELCRPDLLICQKKLYTIMKTESWSMENRR